MSSPVGKNFQLRSSGAGRSQPELIRAARSALRAGDVWQADRYANQAMAMNPQNPAAMALMGALAGRSGRLMVGIQLVERSLERMPGDPDALSTLGQLYRQAGRHQEAMAILQRSMEKRPADAETLIELGVCHLEQQRPLEALPLFQRAVALDPGIAPYHHNLGTAYERLGALADAARSYGRSVQLAPDKPMSHSALGLVLLALNDRTGAIRHLKEAHRLDAGSAYGLTMLAQAQLEEGCFDEALETLTKAVRKDPRCDPALGLLGSTLQQLGRFEEAEPYLRMAIEVQPNSAAAYQTLLSGRKVHEADRPLVEEATRLGDSGRIAEADAMILHYAIGKARDDLGEYEEAMRHFDRANALGLARLKATGAEIDKIDFTRFVEATTATYTPDLLAQRNIAGSDSELPVLIVGMIRSGTTLTEQILSSHPRVGGAGELSFWRDVVVEERRAGGDPWRNAAEKAGRYLELLRSVDPGAERVTDKMPANFLALGLIHLVLPNARIIHCRRDPVDTCLSIYMTPFRVSPDFGHDRDTMVFYYRRYEELMDHWRSVLPADRFLEIDYEELVSEGEPVIRRMVEFIGLEWDDACLRHEENEHAITTPSRWQARQPLYTTSTRKWRKYEPWLGAFEQLQSHR